MTGLNIRPFSARTTNTAPEKDSFEYPTDTSRIGRDSKPLLSVKARTNQGFTIWTALRDDLAKRALHLAHGAYKRRGYSSRLTRIDLQENPQKVSHDRFTLLALTHQGQDAATISLAFDSPRGLPADDLYARELAPLRAQGRRLVEVTQLAFSEEGKGSRMLLVRLFNLIFLYAKRIRGYDDFVIEVHPRHVNYYRRMLGFEILGGEKPCARVNGAPAMLLRLDLEQASDAIDRLTGFSRPTGEHTIYPFFLNPTEEGPILDRLQASLSNEQPVLR